MIVERSRFRIFPPSHFSAIKRSSSKDAIAKERAQGVWTLSWNAADGCWMTSDEGAAAVMESVGCDVFDRMLPGYRRAIWKVTGCELEDAAVIEELMRVEYPTLDHLDAMRFDEEARIAAATLYYFRKNDPDIAQFYEESVTR